MDRGNSKANGAKTQFTMKVTKEEYERAMGIVDAYREKNGMNRSETIDVLSQFNQWRQGGAVDLPSYKSVTMALQCAIKFLRFQEAANEKS